MRVVLDPNVIISALLSRERPFGCSRLRERVTQADVDELPGLLRSKKATRHDGPVEPPPLRSPDPDDDYLIALAAASQAALVSGDRHLLGLSPGAPGYSPTAFLGVLV